MATLVKISYFTSLLEVLLFVSLLQAKKVTQKRANKNNFICFILKNKEINMVDIKQLTLKAFSVHHSYFAPHLHSY